jgi:type II secretory pathway component PulL
VGFIRVLAIIILVYYIFKFIGRVVLPWFIKHQVNKFQQRQANAYRDYHHEQKRREGEVTVQYQKKADNSKHRDGEYVDYEEIK